METVELIIALPLDFVNKIFPIRGYFFPVGLLYLVVTPYIYYYMSWLGIALLL